MADIKVKQVAKKTVKTLDKGAIATERLKDTIVHTKEKAENTQSNDSNIVEDGSNKISLVTNRIIDETVYHFNKYGKKSITKTKDNVIKSKVKIKTIKDKLLAQKKKRIETKSRKNAIKTSKTVIKNTQKVARESVKTSQRAVKLAKETAKRTAQGIKITVKATVSAIKAIIVATKALITAIAAGGWIAVIIIILMCLVGLLCSSILGIFFSSEKSSNNSITMNNIVTELNGEMANKIATIQKENQYDDYVLKVNRAEWKDVLTIYAAKVSNGDNKSELITLNDYKISVLKTIFWDMNIVTFEVKQELVDVEQTENGITTLKKIQKKILHINITHKSIYEMINLYNFTPIQRQQVNELLDEKYDNLWSSVIFGTSIGSPDIVKIALSQIGIGGQPFWSWYGFNSRVEWCACFVSWCAEQCGYITSGVIPKFAGVSNGIKWFKAVGQWKDNNFIPNSGDIIFFDWETDGSPDHVGIVEKVENNVIYTIEGNSNDDTCRKKEYNIGSKVIFGYGTPAY